MTILVSYGLVDNISLLMFRSSHISFLVFGHFWQQSYKNKKILHNFCLHFARQDGKDGKDGKENHVTL